MNYSSIKYFDTADGSGIRTALYVSGCRIHCKGCHNFEAWDFNSGKPFTDIELNEIIESLKPDYISGLSILGGEPTEPENAIELAKIISKIKEELPKKNIWVYSGRIIEALDNLANEDSEYGRAIKFILSKADILIDGPFLEEQRDITLKFRGSSNQRIIDLKSRKELNPEKV